MKKQANPETQARSSAVEINVSAFFESDCSRCGGLLVVDHCFDVLGDAGEIDCQVYRCIQCGDVVDPVILRHRVNPPALAPKKHVKWSSLKLAAMGYR